MDTYCHTVQGGCKRYRMWGVLWVWLEIVASSDWVDIRSSIKKKKIVTEALLEANMLFKNGVICSHIYDNMRVNIANGKMRDMKYYKRKMKSKQY